MKSYEQVLKAFITKSPNDHSAVMHYLATHYTALDREIADSPDTKLYVAELIDKTLPNCPPAMLPDVLLLTLTALTMGVIIGHEMHT